MVTAGFPGDVAGCIPSTAHQLIKGAMLLSFLLPAASPLIMQPLPEGWTPEANCQRASIKVLCALVDGFWFCFVFLSRGEHFAPWCDVTGWVVDRQAV